MPSVARPIVNLMEMVPLSAPSVIKLCLRDGL